MKAAHARSDNDTQVLRISIDTKAKLKMGEFSRGGRLRHFEAVKALDHDMAPNGLLVPFGILEVKQKQFNVVYGNSIETSNFIVDGLEHWWRYRTQFIKRLVDWSDKIQLPIELVYYPPYHSKYNPVEHCWGVLESHWSGALLTDIDVVREWTKTMRWSGIAPNVYCLEKEYQRGVKLTKNEMKEYGKRLIRTVGIERWSLTIKTYTRVENIRAKAL